MAAKNTKISRLLLTKGITGTQVAKATKLNVGHVSNIKNGYQNVTMATLKKLCKFFECTPNDILEFEKWKN